MKLKQLILIDIESTCWEKNVQPGETLETFVDPFPMEIIDIGLSTLDLDDGDIESYQCYVKPEFSTISEFCTKLTGITNETVKNGVSFPEACQWVRGFFRNGETPVWGSWGNFDRQQFIKQCTRDTKYPYITMPIYPFGTDHINVKTLYGLLYPGEQKHLGLADATRRFLGGFVGEQHSGMWDSYNVARMARKICGAKHNG